MSHDRWTGTHPTATYLHEVGHVVHDALGLVPAAATAASFPGMMANRCGDGSDVVRRAVEAYARRYCYPSRIDHPRPAGRTEQQVDAESIMVLDRSNACRMVPRTGPR